MSSARIELMSPFLALLVKRLPEIYDGLLLLRSDPYFLWNRLDAFAYTIPNDIKDEYTPSVIAIRKKLSAIRVDPRLSDFEQKRQRSLEETTYLISTIPSLADKFFRLLNKHNYLEIARGMQQRPNDMF